MSKVLFIGLYFVAAWAFAAYIKFSDPLAVADEYLIPVSASFGMGLGIFLMAGIIPCIISLIGLLRPSASRPGYNRAALILWPFFGLILGFSIYTAEKFDREQKIKTELGQEFTPSQRTEFVSGVKSLCIKTQRQADINRQLGATDQQITAYCNCYATQVSRVVEMEELRYYARNGKMPETFARKIPAVYQACSASALKK
jgi:hypothetical protein